MKKGRTSDAKALAVEDGRRAKRQNGRTMKDSFLAFMTSGRKGSVAGKRRSANIPWLAQF